MNRIKKTKFKVHYMVIDTSIGVFKSIQTAELFLDTLRKNIETICRMMQCQGLFYCGLSISEKDTILRTGRKSRLTPGAVEKDAHLHGICIVEKQSAFAHKLKGYLYNTKAIKGYQSQNPDKKGVYIDSIHEYDELCKRLNYRVSQSYKFRTIDTCSIEFAQKYAGDFVALIEAKEKAMGNPKLVFPQYAQMDLDTDMSVFDFSTATKKPHDITQSSELWKINNEVWKPEMAIQSSLKPSKSQENVPLSQGFTPFLDKYTENSRLLRPYRPSKKPFTENNTCRKNVQWNNNMYSDNYNANIHTSAFT